MLAITNDLFTLEDLQRGPEDQRFRDSSLRFLAGRCLLDVMEYLRADPKFPAAFRQLENAHAMRVMLRCFDTMDRNDLIQRFKPQVKSTSQQLLQSRNEQPPYYGSDLWDWAYTIEALLEVKRAYPDVYDHENQLRWEVRSYFDCLIKLLDSGLSFGHADEWTGPGVAVAAHRILNACKAYLPSEARLPEILPALRDLALTRIKDGKYLGMKVVPPYYQWHYGQVVDEFPADSQWQYDQLRDLEPIKRLSDRTSEAYALTRVIQGTFKRGNTKATDAALEMIFKCERKERPFGTGIIGEMVKGSVNVLEAIWPVLNSEDRAEVGVMADRLLECYQLANIIGIAVAVEREFEECRSAFLNAGADVKSDGDILRITHAKYRAVVVKGKALAAAQEATKKLINDYKARWLFMVGIAGSLGESSGNEEKSPDLGDVLIATSLAPYKIREKVRQGEAQNVPVPFQGLEWDIIPAHPGLFATALRAVQQSTKLPFETYAGLIVTGTGIKDDPEEKMEILKEYPGGLAAEEESYMFSLVCALHGKPYLVLRGLSDLVGYKLAQQEAKGGDDEKQRRAARNAAKVAAKVVDLLSDSWGVH